MYTHAYIHSLSSCPGKACKWVTKQSWGHANNCSWQCLRGRSEGEHEIVLCKKNDVGKGGVRVRSILLGAPSPWTLSINNKSHSCKATWTCLYYEYWGKDRCSLCDALCKTQSSDSSCFSTACPTFTNTQRVALTLKRKERESAQSAGEIDKDSNSLTKLPEGTGTPHESCMMGANLDKWKKKEQCAWTTNPYATFIFYFHLNKKNSDFIPGIYIPT